MNRAPITVAILLTLALAGCNIQLGGTPAIQGSGKRATETRQTGEFTGISLEGSADVDVKIGDKTSVVVEGDDNLLKLITTQVKDGTLTISNRESYRTEIGIRVHITTPKLESVSIPGSGSISTGSVEAGAFDASVPGSGRMTIEELRAETVTASLPGSGEININDLKSRTLAASIDGSGSIHVTGTAETLELSLAGSGNLDVHELSAQDVSVVVSGSGNADVRSAGNLSASVSGSGNVNYSGNPKSVEKSITGSGTVQAD